MDPILERARAGEQGALEQLLNRLAPSIYRFASRMCRNEADAEDVLQDALLSVASHLADYEGRSSLSSWAFALTRSACARRRRGLKNQPAAADDVSELSAEARSPEEAAEARELADSFARALDGLPSEYREALLLRDVEGLSTGEAADALGISIEALKSRLHRARAALRQALEPIATTEPVRVGCPDVAALWSKKLEGDLSQHDCAQMEQHIQTCPACATACDALRRALGACQRAATSAEVPPRVQARVKLALRAWAARAGI